MIVLLLVLNPTHLSLQTRMIRQLLVIVLLCILLTAVSPSDSSSVKGACSKLFIDADFRGLDQETVEALSLECSLYHSQSHSCHKNSSFPSLTSFDSEVVTKYTQLKLPNGGAGIVGPSRKRVTALLTKLALTLPPEGDLVETGCFIGTSAAIMLQILVDFDGCHRKLWVFDSFAGLPDLVEEDKDGVKGEYSTTFDIFKSNLEGLGLYDENRLVITKGWFNETLPISPVKHIAFLRLDGDLFTSTWDALVSLYDKVLPGGVVYVDDYGSYRGCRDAIEKFRGEYGIHDPVHYIREDLPALKIPRKITFEAIWWIKESKRYYPMVSSSASINREKEREEMKKQFFSYTHFENACQKMNPKEGLVATAVTKKDREKSILWKRSSSSTSSSSSKSESIPCSFKGKNDDGTSEVADCQRELANHDFVYKYVKPSDVVLEIGARYGTTSSAIAYQLQNSGKQVSVEPDSSVWSYLEDNRRSHSCNYWIYHGAISDFPYTLAEHGHETRMIPDLAVSSVSSTLTASNSSFSPPSSRASFMSMHQLQSLLNLKFNVLVIDCEGCLPSLLSGNVHHLTKSLKHIRLILLEADMGINAPNCNKDCVDYNVWIKKFQDIGYKFVEETSDPVVSFVKHYVFLKE
jgi:FkbM family methyltransferase